MKNLIKKIIIVCISVFLTVVFFEIALNFLNYSYTPLRIKLIGKYDWRFKHACSDKNYIYDPYLIWKPKENFGVFNSQGYRGSELPVDKTPDSCRIFIFGDSNVIGWTQTGYPNWPGYLQELFAKDNNIKTV